MVHVPHLIQDLALILAAAGVVTLLFRKLGQPVVLGYILAGFLVGPSVKIFPSITDGQSVQVWAEIGVVFLLFALGLEFSFRKLLRVGAPASISALFEIACMIGLGYGAGRLLGWGSMDSLFLGGLLSISSTTIIARAFDEMKLKERRFAQLVLGILVVEDLAAVVLLVLLSAVAAGGGIHGATLAFETLKVLFFLALWFTAGLFLVPSLFRRARSFLNDETLLIVSLALCFGMVVLAAQAGFSPALGAFVMGSLVAETGEAHRASDLIRPVRDLFGAVFFVSVGMLLDPATIASSPGTIALLVVLTVFGKLFSTSAGALLAGQPLKTSVQAGLSLAQIGEFSFIIASLGLTLGVTGAQLYPIAVAVSVVTTLLTPYLIRSGDGLTAWIERRLSPRMNAALSRFSAGSQEVQSRPEWSRVLRGRLVRVALNAPVAVAILHFGQKSIHPWMLESLADPIAAGFATGLVALACAAPFLWALSFGGMRLSPGARQSRRPFELAPLVTFEILRALLGLGLAFGFMVRLLPEGTARWYTVGLLVLLMVVFSSRVARVYRWFENRFLENVGEGAERDHEHAPAAPLAPWDAHIAVLEVPAESACAGHTLLELGVRERFGVTIALIERGRRRLAAPSRDERLLPHDRVSAIGTDEQLARLRAFFGEALPAASFEGTGDYVLRPFTVSEKSPLTGKTIRESGLRDSTLGLVVGVERAGKRHLNPESTMQLASGDILWIVGDAERLAKASL